MPTMRLDRAPLWFLLMRVGSNRGVLLRGLVGDSGKDFLMKRIGLLIILLFSFSMLSLADNARFDARREAE